MTHSTTSRLCVWRYDKKWTFMLCSYYFIRKFNLLINYMSKIKIKIRDAMLDALKSENPIKRGSAENLLKLAKKLGVNKSVKKSNIEKDEKRKEELKEFFKNDDVKRELNTINIDLKLFKSAIVRNLNWFDFHHLRASTSSKLFMAFKYSSILLSKSSS